MTASFHYGTTPEFGDTAFDPHDAYIFDESTSMEHFQRDVDSPYESNDGIQSDHLAKCSHQTGNNHEMGMSSNDSRQDFQPHLSPPQDSIIDHGNGEISPATNPWQTLDSFLSQAQAGAIGHRDGGVAQRFGQVTPVTSQSRSPSSISEDAQQQQIAQSNAKSERARNAANHRHLQTKQARDLVRRSRKVSASRREEQEEGEKSRGTAKQEYREKNRQAAAKCRRKKKDSTEILENSARSAVEENTHLKNMVRHLRDQYSDLRTKALAHDGTEGCGCSDIHHYNAGQAQHTARGHASNAPMMAPDFPVMQAFHTFPTMPTMDSPVDGSMIMPEMSETSMGTPLDRTQFLAMESRPEAAIQHPQHIRADSQQDEIEQHAAALQFCSQDFAFDPSLGGTQEDENKDAFQ